MRYLDVDLKDLLFHQFFLNTSYTEHDARLTIQTVQIHNNEGAVDTNLLPWLKIVVLSLKHASESPRRLFKM